MGTVYAGHDERLDRPVAIKVLRRDLADDPSLRRRFEREARSAARISHPCAVAVYDTGEDPTHDAFIVMDLLSGRTFADELADGPLDEARLRSVADDVLAALGAAHAEGIVHRDVKPGNILLADGGRVKVGDFGIATTLDASDTITNVPFGTPAYIAPERLRGLPATEQSDLYSLAVVLYEAASGVRPFSGRGAGAVAEAVVVGRHVPLSSREPQLSAPFVDAVERALANDPAERFLSADDMRVALTQLHEADVATVGHPITATVPIAGTSETAALPVPPRTGSGDAPRTGGRRGVVKWLAAAAAFVAAVTVVLVLVTGSGDHEPPMPSTTAPTVVTVAPVKESTPSPLPAPMDRALERLEQATRR
jgi:serine/threonine-protein kinase